MVKSTRKDGRIPIMSESFKKKVLANLEKNRTWGGSASTKKEAEQIATKLKKEGYQALVSKVADNVWLVEKSRVNFREM